MKKKKKEKKIPHTHNFTTMQGPDQNNLKSHKTEFIFLRLPSYQTEIINKIKKKNEREITGKCSQQQLNRD